MKKYADNSFNSGLNLDDNPITIDNHSLTNCLNGTLITYNGNEFILQNDLGNGRVETAKLPKGYVPVGMKEHGGVIYVASVRPDDGMCQIGSFPSPERNISSEEINSNNTSSIKPELYFNSGSLTIKKKLFDAVKINPGDKLKINLKDHNDAVLTTDVIEKKGYSYKIIPAVQTENSGLVKLKSDYITKNLLLPYSEKLVGELYTLVELNYSENFDVTNDFDDDGNLVFTFSGDYEYISVYLENENKEKLERCVLLLENAFTLKPSPSDGIIQYHFTPCIGDLKEVESKEYKLIGIKLSELTLLGIADSDVNKRYDRRLNFFDSTWKEDKQCWQINYSLAGMSDVTSIDLNLYYYNTNDESWTKDTNASKLAPKKTSYNGSFNINLYPSLKLALYYLEIDIKSEKTPKTFYQYLMSNGLKMLYVSNTLPNNANVVTNITSPSGVTGGTVYEKTDGSNTKWYYYYKENKVTHIGTEVNNVVTWSLVDDFYQLNLNISAEGDLVCDKKQATSTIQNESALDVADKNHTFTYKKLWIQEFEIKGDYLYYITEQDSIGKIVPTSVTSLVTNSVKLNIPAVSENDITEDITQTISGDFDDVDFESESKISKTVTHNSDRIKVTVKMPYLMKGNTLEIKFLSDTPRFAPYIETDEDFKKVFGYLGSLDATVAEYGLSGAWGRTKDNNFRTRFGLRKFGGNDDKGEEVKTHSAYNNAKNKASFSDLPNDQTWYWKTNSNRVSVHDKYQSFVQSEFGKIPPVSFWIGSNAWEDTWDSKDGGVPNDCSGYLTDHNPDNYTFNFVFILWKHKNGVYYISNQKFPKEALNDIPSAMQALLHYFKNLYVYKSDTISLSRVKYKMNDYKFVTENTASYDFSTQLTWGWSDNPTQTYTIKAPEGTSLKNVTCYFTLPNTKQTNIKFSTDKQSIAAEVLKYISHNPTNEEFGIGIQLSDGTIKAKDSNGNNLTESGIYFLNKSETPVLLKDVTVSNFKDSPISALPLNKSSITYDIFKGFADRMTLQDGEIVLNSTGTLVKQVKSRNSTGAFSIGDYFGGDSDNKHGLGREASFLFTSSENQPYVMSFPIVSNYLDAIKSYGTT